jgi:hypothetical protein
MMSRRGAYMKFDQTMMTMMMEGALILSFELSLEFSLVRHPYLLYSLNSNEVRNMGSLT